MSEESVAKREKSCEKHGVFWSAHVEECPACQDERRAASDFEEPEYTRLKKQKEDILARQSSALERECAALREEIASCDGHGYLREEIARAERERDEARADAQRRIDLLAKMQRARSILEARIRALDAALILLLESAPCDCDSNVSPSHYGDCPWYDSIRRARELAGQPEKGE
jgi:hypothetical protein